MSHNHFGSALFQNLFGLLRVMLFLAGIPTFAALCAMRFHQVIPAEYLALYLARVPLLGLLPSWAQGWIAASFNPYSFRYMIAPLFATLAVLFAGAYYVKDVYALPSFGLGFRYVLASMFAVRYPEIVIDGGEVRKKAEINLIEKIGGPGFVQVEPGSAALFRHLREISRPVVGAIYFLAPFETLEFSVDLDEQQGDKDQINAITRDGIQVVLRDVHFGYRIRHQTVGGRSVQRTPSSPYPFDPAAINNMIANLPVTSGGRVRWNAAVEGAVTGTVIGFIASNTIDYLTAPNTSGADPRGELRNILFPGVSRALEGLGAELQWIDAGHLEIVKDVVDEERTNVWAAGWVGDANVTRAYGDALRQAYRDLGRAQAQAEMILSITDALANANLAGQPAANIRRILLARTAQVLDSLHNKAEG